MNDQEPLLSVNVTKPSRLRNCGRVGEAGNLKPNMIYMVGDYVLISTAFFPFCSLVSIIHGIKTEET